jgi:hypothetical protein
MDRNKGKVKIVKKIDIPKILLNYIFVLIA